MAPPVVVCVLASIFYPKANTRAAAATLIVGVVLGGYGFFGIDYPKQSTGLAYLSNPFNIGFLTLIACVLVMVLVSQFTQASDDDLEKTAAVTAARTTNIDEMTAGEKRIYRVTLFVLVAILVGVPLLFSPIGIGK